MADDYNVLQRFIEIVGILGFNTQSISIINKTPAQICNELMRESPHALIKTKLHTFYYKINGKTRAFRNFKLHNKANYGESYIVDSITIENNKSTIEEKLFVKKSYFDQDDMEENHSMFREALLQILAQCVFEKYNLSWVIPSVIDIMKEGKITLFTMVPKTNAVIYDTYLKNNIKKGVPCVENDSMILSVIVQLCVYVEILTHELQMTHRDMKCTNVLMVTKQNVAETMQIQVSDWKIQLHTQIRTILVDFGMSCIPDNSRTNGKYIFTPHYLSWMGDVTPRDGRDLYLFFADLWSKEWIRISVSEQLGILFRKWLGDNINVKELEKFGEKAFELLFTKIGGKDIDCSTSSTKKVLDDIHELYPNLITFL
jgi:hypothetical protein